eukprot:scaffold234008_cov19-Tisochrysis_lutea.AAC.1
MNASCIDRAFFSERASTALRCLFSAHSACVCVMNKSHTNLRQYGTVNKLCCSYCACDYMTKRSLRHGKTTAALQFCN